MGLAGIWHGAGWQFLVFGLLHGALLVANHAWRYAGHRYGLDWNLGWPGRAAGVLATFLTVTVTLVFFKASSLEHAFTVVQGMAGLGEAGPATPRLGGIDPATLGPIGQLLSRLASLPGVLVMAGLAIVWLLPNTPYYVSLLAEPVQSRI